MIKLLAYLAAGLVLAVGICVGMAGYLFGVQGAVIATLLLPLILIVVVMRLPRLLIKSIIPGFTNKSVQKMRKKLAGAKLEIHGIEASNLPEALLLESEDAEDEIEDELEDDTSVLAPEDEYPLSNPRLLKWFRIESSVLLPDKSYNFDWQPDCLCVVKNASVDEDNNIAEKLLGGEIAGIISEYEVFNGSEFQKWGRDSNFEFRGSKRLRFHLGLPKLTRSVKLTLWGQELGIIDLPT